MPGMIGQSEPAASAWSEEAEVAVVIQKQLGGNEVRALLHLVGEVLEVDLG